MFTLTLNPGAIPNYRKVGAPIPVYVRVEWTGDRLSITGVEGPRRGGDCDGSCGQIDVSRITYPADGWTPDMIAQLAAVWKRWHLNDMTAGSPAQEAYLREHPVSAVYPQSHYDEACKALAAVGLNPDPNYLTADHKPYAYGSAWLREEVPADVLAWLQSLPPSKITPAWV